MKKKKGGGERERDRDSKKKRKKKCMDRSRVVPNHLEGGLDVVVAVDDHGGQVRLHMCHAAHHYRVLLIPAGQLPLAGEMERERTRSERESAHAHVSIIGNENVN